MDKRVGIVGIGTTGFRATTPDLSYRELTYEAASKAYLDAGIEPKQVGAFVCTSEDMLEGYSIADEYAPDQVGAVLKPCHSVPGDFIQSLANGVMLVQANFADLVVIQGLSKASNMLTKGDLITMASDPFTWRPLKESHHAIAAMEMNRYLWASGATREQCAEVVVRNRRQALENPRAAHGCDLELADVLGAESVSTPLGKLDIAQHADGAVVCVIASEDRARSLKRDPIWIRGLGWSTETNSLDSRTWDEAVYLKKAAEMAYRMAGIRSPAAEIDFAEINDEYSYKQLMHMEALGLCGRGSAGPFVEMGLAGPDGDLPINVSGGSLGSGHLFELDGGQKVLEAVLQLRGQAGQLQLEDVHVGLAASWRGVPTTTGAVVVLGN
jgi:acetyl-CoA C-acetyltransferase